MTTESDVATYGCENCTLTMRCVVRHTLSDDFSRTAYRPINSVNWHRINKGVLMILRWKDWGRYCEFHGQCHSDENKWVRHQQSWLSEQACFYCCQSHLLLTYFFLVFIKRAAILSCFCLFFLGLWFLSIFSPYLWILRQEVVMEFVYKHTFPIR